ncbi:protein kinase [Pyxidicoccus sp. MSG2]|nr:protein kinase [Pyxidicoccus sp. MSG2]
MPDERILELHDVALNCDLAGQGTQLALLEGIDPGCVASIPVGVSPAATLMATLFRFNGIERLADGSVPLMQWLQRAWQLSRALQVAEHFQRCLQELSSGPARVARGDTPPRDARLSEELRLLHEQRAAALGRGEDTGALLEAIRRLKRRAATGVELQPGDLLGDGRYQLLELLGSGGYGAVWEAWDHGRERYVAIKVLHGHLVREPTRVDRFFRGAEKMSQLSHPNIVKVLLKKGEEQRDDGARHLYYVMELLKGGDFKQRAPSGEQAVLGIALAVCDALAFAHQHKLLHRDVSPDNILLDEAGVAHLSDFDLVRAEDTTAATHEGRMMGKYGFAAPEVLDGRAEPDARADVYSLGMTLLFTLNGGHLPPSGVAREPVIHGLKCSALLREVLLGATWDAVEKRHADMGAFRKALERVRDSRGPARLAGWARMGARRHGRAFGRYSVAVTLTAVVLMLLPLAAPVREGLLRLASDAPPKTGEGPSEPDGATSAWDSLPPGMKDAPQVAARLLIGDRMFATAFFVTARGHLVTASNVFDEGRSRERAQIELLDGMRYDVQRIDVDEKLGLALLKADLRPDRFASWASVMEGRPILVEGLQLRQLPRYPGRVESRLTRFVGRVLPSVEAPDGRFLIEVERNDGTLGGGPVLDEAGSVMGLVHSGFAPTDKSRSRKLCIPASTIRDYVDRVLNGSGKTDSGP